MELLYVTIIAVNVDPTTRYLYLRVLKGKAFVEHLHEAARLPGTGINF